MNRRAVVVMFVIVVGLVFAACAFGQRGVDDAAQPRSIVFGADQ